MFGNVGVPILRSVVAVAVVVVVVVLLRPVAMADPIRDGRRENTGGVGLLIRALPSPPAESLYLRGELPWYAVAATCACRVTNGFGSGIDSFSSLALLRGGVGEVCSVCTGSL
jgi:hypothetical protein